MSGFLKIPKHNKLKDGPIKLESWINSRSVDESREWGFAVADKKGDVTVMNGIEKDCDEQSGYLKALLELLKWTKNKQYKIQLTVYSHNLYIVNCVRDFLPLWKKADFKHEGKDRPYAAYLRQIASFENVTFEMVNSFDEEGLTKKVMF